MWVFSHSMAASTDRDTRPGVVSAGPPRLVSFADESGRRVRCGAVDRGCAAVRDPAPRGCLRAAGVAVVARTGARPEGAALSGRRRRGVPEDDSPVASVRVRRGVGSARRGPLRREVAAVDVVAAGRLRGSRPFSVVMGVVDLFVVVDVRTAGLVAVVAVGLSPPAIVPWPTVPPRCEGVRPPVLARAAIHSNYPREAIPGNRIGHRNTAPPGSTGVGMTERPNIDDRRSRSVERIVARTLICSREMLERQPKSVAGTPFHSNSVTSWKHTSVTGSSRRPSTDWGDEGANGGTVVLLPWITNRAAASGTAAYSAAPSASRG